MKLKLLAVSALAALTLGTGFAQAAESVAEAKAGISTISPTTPQVAYPPKCGRDPIFPRYCRRW